MECFRDNFISGVVLGGRYRTISPLNHGSFGMVFMAKDLKTSQTVAVKCLTKKSAVNEVGLDFAVDEKSEELVLHRFLETHPNIVNLLDSFETDVHVYLVLEFCQQGDLYEAIRRGHGPLETEHVRQFMLELVDAVRYIHDKGIYHRDIKPENIFLTQSGTMKLGDFGLATTERWTYETTVGSDRYMSPEQYDSAGAGYSPAQADIWAVGICLLNILFSRNPFTTPTEADPLFLDFSKDKQSLFDVFPSMSQDTYEVIVQCMNMDPSKRSLAGARDALCRVVTFTTEDEALDDFCTADCRVVASANREPLRTPSIQSPLVDVGTFPWAKALQASPQKHARQLSVIADNESYTEDLFSKSGATTTDWFSGSADTPSISSVLDSSLGASMQSLAIRRPKLQTRQSGFKVSPMAGSLPIAMSKTKNLSAMSLVFGGGRKETVSKSWSDMWDEDVEETEEDRAHQLEALKELNSRTWSNESKVQDDNTPRQGLSPSTRATTNDVNVPSIESTISNNVDDDLVADGFFFQEDLPEQKTQQLTPNSPPLSPPLSGRYSPPSKRNALDRWAALGERRRAHTGNATTLKAPDASMKPASNPLDGFGLAALSHGVPDFRFNAHAHVNVLNQNNNHHNIPLQSAGQHGPSAAKWSSQSSRDRSKDWAWNNKSRDRDWNWNFNWRKEKRHDFGDVEWVGGWQETQS